MHSRSKDSAQKMVQKILYGHCQAKRYNLRNTYSNYSSILTYNETGFVDYSSLFDAYEDSYEIAEDTAGDMLQENIQDQTMRTGLALAGWRPTVTEMAAQAAEWWEWGESHAHRGRMPVQKVNRIYTSDFEAACPPEESSFIFGVAGSNLTFNQFGDANNFVFDQRGFNAIVKGEASTFLQQNDPRLLLNTVVTNISYSNNGVTIYNNDGTCVSAAYAVCTFSLGVLQSDTVAFQPELPQWKQTAIQNFQMATYTKIFLQFNETFWPNDTQFFLYASPTTRGYYPVFQSLSTTGFLPESNIIFVTVVDEEAYRVERQTDEQTKDEVLDVLRQMFPDVDIPEPVAFMYPRWTMEPWAHGSYSNWPSSTTLEIHQNLRANVGRLWFAGEAISAQYFGFLHGAWFTGRDVGERIAGLLGKTCAAEPKPAACGNERHYEVLHGTTTFEEYSAINGWPLSSL
ncbi:hypothetical protein DV736_g637, partial [Chaetothyriales sp. CBS 134916]